MLSIAIKRCILGSGVELCWIGAEETVQLRRFLKIPSPVDAAPRGLHYAACAKFYAKNAARPGRDHA